MAGLLTLMALIIRYGPPAEVQVVSTVTSAITTVEAFDSPGVQTTTAVSSRTSVRIHASMPVLFIIFPPKTTIVLMLYKLITLIVTQRY